MLHLTIDLLLCGPTCFLFAIYPCFTLKTGDVEDAHTAVGKIKRKVNGASNLCARLSEGLIDDLYKDERLLRPVPRPLN